MRCPCETCLVLACCKHKKKIDCSNLWVYVHSFERHDLGGSYIDIFLSGKTRNNLRVYIAENFLKSMIVSFSDFSHEIFLEKR